MNRIEQLIKMDRGAVTAAPSKEIEIKRLSKISGAPFLVTLRAISGERLNSIANMIDNGEDSANFKRSCHMLLASMADPDLKDKELMEHFGAKTPLDALTEIFLVGEIMQMAETVADLSGFNGSVETEIKN